MLRRGQFNQAQFIALVNHRQRAVFIAFTQRWHHFGPTVKAQGTATRFEFEIARFYGQRGGVVLRWRHLTGHELAPDQLIQFLRVRFHIFQRFRLNGNIGRTNRFVRFLRVFFAGVLVRVLRQVFFAKVIADIVANHAHRILTQVSGVGTHVGDVARFIQTLRHHHGFLHAEAQTRAGRLLQRGGNKRRARLAAGRLVFTLQHAIAGFFQQADRSHSFVAVNRTERLVALMGHFQRQGIAARRGGAGVNFPEFFRHKRFNFAFAFNDQTYRYRLDATGG